MELRARTRPLLRRAALVAAIPALLAPAVAGTATAEAAKRKSPVVTSIAPKSVSVGETLTIRGRYFRAGRGKNTIAFKRDGGRAVFVKADLGTRKLLKVKLPKKLEGALVVRNGLPAPTRLRIRVLSTRFGKSFTVTARSPMVGPEKPPTPPTPPTASATGDCDGDKVLNGVDTDDDNDLLPDTLEVSLKTDPCKADSDGDGVGDGYEYKSAIDLNDDDYQSPNQSIPYPTKRPYPNALYDDGAVDYDGDGLTLHDEYLLWVRSGVQTLSSLTYSDGKQYSLAIAAVGYDKQAKFLADAAAIGYSQPTVLDFNRNGTITDVERYYYDANYDGRLSDNERDEDADGLPNWVEAHGYMTPDWWKAVYNREVPFTLPYAGTAIDDGDSDGDGIPDGADDQDHDEYPNVVELSRRLTAGLTAAWSMGDTSAPSWVRPLQNSNDAAIGTPLQAWTQPFNPCLPDRHSRTCPIYTPVQNPYAPFDPNGPAFLVFN